MYLRQNIIKVEGAAIELIFLDIRMQGMNGTEVLRHIRGMGNKCPVVIMTAFATVKNAVDCTKLGAVVYLQKPFSPERVNAVLDEVNEFVNQKRQNNRDSFIANYIELAKKQIDEKNFEEAHSNFTAALGLNSYGKEVYYLLARVNEGVNNNIEAEKFYKIVELFNE